VDKSICIIDRSVNFEWYTKSTTTFQTCLAYSHLVGRKRNLLCHQCCETDVCQTSMCGDTGKPWRRYVGIQVRVDVTMWRYRLDFTSLWGIQVMLDVSMWGYRLGLMSLCWDTGNAWRHYVGIQVRLDITMWDTCKPWCHYVGINVRLDVTMWG